MQIYEILKREHQNLRHLLTQLEESTDSAVQRRFELLGALSAEWAAYAHAKEKVFYDTVKEITGFEALATTGLQQNQRIEVRLRELSELPPFNDEWFEKLSGLKKKIEAHLRQEERLLFESAHRVFDNDEALMMGKSFQKVRERMSGGSKVHNALHTFALYMPTRVADRIHDLIRTRRP